MLGRSLSVFSSFQKNKIENWIQSSRLTSCISWQNHEKLFIFLRRDGEKRFEIWKVFIFLLGRGRIYISWVLWKNNEKISRLWAFIFPDHQLKNSGSSRSWNYRPLLEDLENHKDIFNHFKIILILKFVFIFHFIVALFFVVIFISSAIPLWQITSSPKERKKMK